MRNQKSSKMPKRKRKSSISAKQRAKNSASLLKRPPLKAEPIVKLEKLDENLLAGSTVKKENDDYIDSLLNDYEAEEFDDSPELDAETGEFKQKVPDPPKAEIEEDDIEIIEEVIKVKQSPIKKDFALQLIKLSKVAPKPTGSHVLKLDPKTGLLHDQAGQEIKIIEQRKEVIKVMPKVQAKNNNEQPKKDSNGNVTIVAQKKLLKPKLTFKLAEPGDLKRVGRLARLQHELPLSPSLDIQRRQSVPITNVVTSEYQKWGNQSYKVLKLDNNHLVPKDQKIDVSMVNDQHCLVQTKQGWVLVYLTKEDWRVLVQKDVAIIRSAKYDE